MTPAHQFPQFSLLPRSRSPQAQVFTHALSVLGDGLRVELVGLAAVTEARRELLDQAGVLDAHQVSCVRQRRSGPFFEATRGFQYGVDLLDCLAREPFEHGLVTRLVVVADLKLHLPVYQEGEVELLLRNVDTEGGQGHGSLLQPHRSDSFRAALVCELIHQEAFDTVQLQRTRKGKGAVSRRRAQAPRGDKWPSPYPNR